MNVEQHLDQIAEKCKHYNIKALYLIGSVARGEDTADSDLDFSLVSIILISQE